MPGSDAITRPTTARERRWGLISAIASVTVFGLSVGQGGPLLPLLLEERGYGATLNGLNAAAPFLGVLIGPLLAPRLVRWWGIRNLLLLAFAADVVLVLSLKVFDHIAEWFVLRALLGLVGSAIFAAGEAWINELAGDARRGQIIGLYAAALSAGLGAGPLVLSLTGIHGWAPFVVNAAITAAAALPLLAAGNASRAFGRERGTSPFTMFARAPLIVGVVAVFGLFEAALMALLPIWGVRRGLSVNEAAVTLSAVYFGSILLQIFVGWLSDRVSRVAALRVCSGIGLAGAALLPLLPASPPLLLALLFLWGGVAAGIYPVALSMSGDRFRGSDLVTINAAMIMAYGIGALVGPPLGGIAMDLDNPQGLLWLFVVLFAGLLAGALAAPTDRARAMRRSGS